MRGPWLHTRMVFGARASEQGQGTQGTHPDEPAPPKSSVATTAVSYVGLATLRECVPQRGKIEVNKLNRSQTYTWARSHTSTQTCTNFSFAVHVQRLCWRLLPSARWTHLPLASPAPAPGTSMQGCSAPAPAPPPSPDSLPKAPRPGASVDAYLSTPRARAARTHKCVQTWANGSQTDLAHVAELMPRLGVARWRDAARGHGEGDKTEGG